MAKQQLHRTKKNNKDNNKSSENVPLTEHNTLKEKYESLMIYQINLQKDSQSSKEIARHFRVFWRKKKREALVAKEEIEDEIQKQSGWSQSRGQGHNPDMSASSSRTGWQE